MRVQDAPRHIHDGELPYVKKAVEKRRREFSAGRFCAREALRQLGCDAGPIAQDAAGAPLWPGDIVGAITHSSTYAAAAVAGTAHLRGIGIDLETVSRVSAVIAGKILTASEKARLQDEPDAQERQRLLALIFSAKEAVYKCLHPIAQRRIGFEDASIECDPSRFAIRIQLSAGLQALFHGLQGRYCFFDDTVCAAVWLAA
jgi:4'-phosphopantetheinyl transferase EntD